MALFDAKIFSRVLNAHTSLSIIMPEKPHLNSEGCHAVLWLLHGGGDDHTMWQRFTSIERYAERHGIAVVMPGVNPHSHYQNMVLGPQVMDYIAEELPQIVARWFPISRRREDNFLAGLSMGCYGAFTIGLTYPDRYCSLGCFSALNVTDLDPAGNDMDGGMPAVFGVPNNGAVAGTKGDLQVLARQAIAGGRPLPTIYHAVGTEDFVYTLVQPTVRFFESLSGNPFHYSFLSGPGGHDFNFWDEWIQKWLRTLPVYGETNTAKWS
jgi:putative tributyrin esterase